MSVSDSQFQQARLARDARFDGRFFVAVKSTGIFCRPICPAPLPKEQNVEYFELAQSALAHGYRPCLRCRPDSAPGSCAWRGVDTTLARAVNLMKEFPQLSLFQLAEKLGISERYLRQLFTQKLGVSPKRYRLYEQLLFAKQLLHQSHMNIEQVAQASGFSCARRLQENLQKALKLTPSQIRRQLSAQVSEPSQGITLQLSYRTPYNWPQVRDFLAKRAIAGVETVSHQGYQRHFSYSKTQGWFDAKHNSTHNRFDVSLHIEDMSQIQKVVGQIRRILDLDADPFTIEQRLLSSGLDPELLVKGLRIPGVWNTFEAGCRAILGQQISVNAAIKLVNTLVLELAESHTQVHHFPSPEQVAQSELLFLGMPQSRRDTLRRFAEYCVANPAQEDLTQWLSIKGIGPWTIAYAQLRGQSLPNIWLDSDLVVKQQLAKHTISAEQAAPWRSYLTFQLWSLA